MKYLFLLIVLICAANAQAQVIDVKTFTVDGQYPIQPPYNLPPAKIHEPSERLFNRGQWIATVFYGTGSTLDATSSRGGKELNPIFRNKHGQYNLPLNLGVKAGVYLIVALVEKRWPKSRRSIRIMMGSAGVALCGIAAHNYAIR